MELLFSYGTLQLKKVQLEIYGRELQGSPDRLMGYRLEELRITDPLVMAKSEKEYHPIAVATGKEEYFVEGTLFEISTEELLESDRYEVDDYQRIKEQFESGRQAWVYVGRGVLPGLPAGRS